MSRATLLIQAAQDARDRGMERVLIGLCVRGVGPAMARKLTERFQSMDRLMGFAGAYMVARKRGYGFREAWAIGEGFVESRE